MSKLLDIQDNMARYCTSVQPYFLEPQASENTAQESNIVLSSLILPYFCST